MNIVDPNQFIITRKRKKYKFAKFANAKNCFELDEWVDVRPQIAVNIVEIGAGTGRFVVDMAVRHPDRVFVAIDVKGDRLQKGAYEALERGLNNVYFIRARADQIDELFAPDSLQAIWLTFSDPFPRKRSAGRRLTHPYFLTQYRRLLLPTSGQLLIKHDDPDFFNWTLEQLVAEQWRVTELSFDLHESKLSSDYKIMTDYERRWIEEGRQTHFVGAST